MAASFVSSLQGRLQAEITRKPDWWTKPNHQLLEEAVAVSKALEGGRRSAGGRSLNYLGQKRPAHHLQVAASRPRTGEERDGSSTRDRQQAVDEKASTDRPPRPTLAAATARRSKDTGRERGSEELSTQQGKYQEAHGIGAPTPNTFEAWYPLFD